MNESNNNSEKTPKQKEPKPSILTSEIPADMTFQEAFELAALEGDEQAARLLEVNFYQNQDFIFEMGSMKEHLILSSMINKSSEKNQK